jgi:3D (Asp-Asp-Asp) domain-containing protein
VKWLIVAILLFVLVATAQAHPAYTSGSTAYCLNGRMADGSQTRAGSVASNAYRLGTKLTISPSPTGRRFFVVRDRIGYGSQLDIWVPSCGQARTWGRRSVTVRVGWHHRKR